MYKLTHLPSSESLVKILPPRVSSLDFRSESLHFVIVQCKTWIHRLRGSLGGFSGDKKDLNHEEVAIISNLFILIKWFYLLNYSIHTEHGITSKCWTFLNFRGTITFSLGSSLRIFPQNWFVFEFRFCKYMCICGYCNYDVKGRWKLLGYDTKKVFFSLYKDVFC